MVRSTVYGLFNHCAKRGGSLSGIDSRRGAYRSHEFAGFEVKKSLSFERNYTKLSGGGVLLNTQGPNALFLVFATRALSICRWGGNGNIHFYGQLGAFPEI